MTLVVNGNPQDTRDGCSVQQLLETLEIHDEAVAVEVNREVVPRAERGERVLTEGDRVEIVTFVGGG